MKSRSVWFTAARKVEICEEELAAPQAGQVLVVSRLSAISPGTEMLFYRGQVPEEMEADATISSLQGKPTFPIKYGYANVGEVVQIGPGVSADWLKRRVFSFHPHESAYLAPPQDLIPIPEGSCLGRCCFSAEYGNGGKFCHGWGAAGGRNRGGLWVGDCGFIGALDSFTNALVFAHSHRPNWLSPEMLRRG